MRKGLLIIFTIAVLGALGLFVNKKPGDSMNASTGSAASTVSSNTSAPASSTNPSSSSGSASASYKDGTYTGHAVDNPYGTVQIALVINGGKITDVKFLQMPNDQGNSRQVTAFAEPQLKQETLAAQSAKIDFVSGATQTSESYEQSLQAALNQAAVS